MNILELDALPDKRLDDTLRQLALYEQLSEDEGVHALLKHAAKLFNSPIILLDPNLRLITQAASQAMSAPICKTISEEAQCNCKGFSCFKDEAVMQEIVNSEDPIYFDDGFAKLLPRIMGKVQVGERVLAFFSIFEINHVLNKPCEIELAKTMARVIGILLRQRSTLLLLEQGDLGSLLAGTLSGQYLDKSQIDRRLDLLGVNKDGWYQMLYIPVIQKDQQFLSVDYLAKRFAALGRLPYFLYRDGSYVLIFASENLLDLRGLEFDVLKVLEETKLRASMGEHFTDLSLLVWQFNLCELIYTHDEPKHKELKLRRIGPSLLSMFVNGKLDSSDTRLVHPDIRFLYDYDLKSKSNLLQTWITHLQEHKHINNTAEKLGIHKNTLIYRIKKIQEMTVSLGQETDDIFYQLYSYEKLLEQ